MELCDALIDLLSAHFSVSGAELRSPLRCRREVAQVRQIGMYLAHTSFGMVMSEVACGFSRDRSTVVYACHLVEDRRDDEDFDAVVSTLEKVVNSGFSAEDGSMSVGLSASETRLVRFLKQGGCEMQDSVRETHVLLVGEQGTIAATRFEIGEMQKRGVIICDGQRRLSLGQSARSLQNVSNQQRQHGSVRQLKRSRGDC